MGVRQANESHGVDEQRKIGSLIDMTLHLGIKLEASLTMQDLPSCIFTENVAQHHLPMEVF